MAMLFFAKQMLGQTKHPAYTRWKNMVARCYYVEKAADLIAQWKLTHGQ